MRRLVLPGLGAVLLLACASFSSGCSTAADLSDEVTASSAAELSANTQGFSVSLASAPRVEMRGGVLAVIVRGTTNQNIDDVFSWVPDDAFGEAKRLSSRSFEVVFRGLSDVNTVLSGLPVNVRMTTAAGAKQFTAQVRLAPVYRKFSGDSEIYVEAPIEPVFAGTPDHPLRYRSTFTTRWPASDATVFSASGGTVPPTRRSSLEWSFDRTFDALAAELDPNDRTIFEARLTGKKRQKRAAVEVKVDGLILTADDPDTAFPPRTCNAQVAACMESRLAKGDVSTCGRYREVSTCIAGPSECLFGWTVDQLFSNAGFSGLGYQRIQAGTTYPIEVQNQVIAAAKQRDPSVTTMAAALALGGGFVARHQVQRLATGARYDAVVFTASDQKMYGAVFRADTTTAAASVKNGFLANCTLLRAEGGVQIGDDCSAQMPCGQGLLCLGVNANVGFGKCVPTEYVAGEGSWCGEIDGSYVSCPSDELVCGSGLCVPAFMHGEFDDGSVTTLTPGGTTTRTIEAYGLATVGMETWVSAALSNVVPSSIILRVMNSSGTLVTLYDGPELALTEPDIDSDNFVEFSELARFPGDESANGTYTLFVETTAGHPAGELLNWHLSVTSRYD